MRKTLIIAVLALLGISQAVAQEYEYMPFVREGVKWICFYNHQYECPQFDPYFAVIGRNYFTIEIKGDEFIDGKSYKAMHLYQGDAIDPLHDTIPLYVREENKIVYGIAPDGHIYPPFLVGYGYTAYTTPNIYHMVQSGQEIVLYDFNDPDSFYNSVLWREYDYIHFEDYLHYLSNDTIDLGDNLAKRHKFNLRSYDFYIIEGVGYDGDHYSGYTLGHLWINLYPGFPFFLSHVIENGKTIYKGIHYDPNQWEHDGIDEVAADKTRRPQDPYYYNLMGQPMGKDMPTAPGIYIHNGSKIVVR